MFSVGDTVVYPIYGAGIIVDIETVKIDGKDMVYYVIDLPNGNLKIRISVKKAEELGVRRIYGDDKLKSAICSVTDVPVEYHENWNQRYKDNLEKIKTGQLEQVTEVYRNLFLREREKGLSGAEKKMLNNTRQIIVSEIVYSCGLDKEKAEEFLFEALFG